MNKTLKKTLSIIIAILMIVTTVPFAFAAEENVIDLSMLTEIYVISDSGEYTFTGSGSYGIKVESGNPTIVLNNASITVGEGSAIDIASGSTTTIFVMGDNTIDTDSMWETAGGIFVAEGGTVNITSNGTDNILRAHGTLAAAIGGKYDYDNNESYNAGSISISNVTVYAYTNNFHAAAIGAAGEGTCGTINITNAVVYAYGAGDRWTSAPGIGSAWSLVSWSETIPVVIISDSEVHTFRHNSGSDYIGYLGDVEIPMNATGSINCGEGGSITNSTIYCYTGLDSTTTDKTVKYGTLGGLLKEDGTCEGNCEGGSATCSVLAICENCGTSYGEFDANKHTLVQKDAKAPTCTEIGWDAYEYCTTCDYTTYVELPAITHTDANCDYKCDYNCGYVYETLDFSDAKILTSDADGNLYIDGKVVSNRYIPGGKYKLGSDMKTDKNCFWIKEGNNVLLDLNGYTWDLVTNYLIVECELSVYDTSANESGKLVSSKSTIQPYESNKLNIYGGTIETTAAEQAIILIDTELNLYGGKIKSNKNAISYRLFDDTVINLYGTVFECGENYGEFSASLFDGTYAEVVLDVSDYTGDSLTVDASISEAGKIVIFEGIENAEAAENFKINYTINESYGVFYEKTEYDEATGEKSIYTAKNAFTQQPSADNNLTVDFNNTAATFQWYEVEEENLGDYEVYERDIVFTYDFKAGDILVISTDSELEFVVIEAGNEYIELMENEKTAITTFDADTTVDFFTAILDADNPVEINFTLINETKLDGETEKTLQKVECGKSYYCKATVGENVYVSDNVNILPVEHNLIQVDAKAPTCTEIGWEAYEYCTACDYTTYEELPADPDAHTPLEAVTENEVAPKCDVAGSYDLVVYCDDCGEELDRDTKTVDALTHTDADGDYICDHGCGYEYEKPAEPTPEEPTPDDPTEDTICEDCGKVHDGFFAELICFFTKIINFIKSLFA